MQAVLNVWNYALTCIVLYMILGVAWYFLDRTYGIHVYRWLYDICHKEPIPPEVVRGFMYNQKTHRKATIAFLISTAQSIYMIWGHDINLLAEIILWLVEVPAMLIGLALGNPFYRLFQRREEVFEVIDTATERAEHIDLNAVKKEAEEKGEELVAVSKGLLTSAPSRLLSFWKKYVFSVHREETPVVVSKPEIPAETLKATLAPAEIKIESSAQEIIANFTKRGRL
ncbi:MAG: hypothetical protein HYT93_04720 [Parcubacteria group bacterium]|nr:hypothetical protein [Parcubacteria group bacterium]